MLVSCRFEPLLLSGAGMGKRRTYALKAAEWLLRAKDIEIHGASTIHLL
jgi:hypothetical protein